MSSPIWNFLQEIDSRGIGDAAGGDLVDGLTLVVTAGAGLHGQLLGGSHGRRWMRGRWCDSLDVVVSKFRRGTGGGGQGGAWERKEASGRAAW